MQTKVYLVYLEFTRDHGESGLKELKSFASRLFPSAVQNLVVLNNASTKNEEVYLAQGYDLISGDNSAREFSGYAKGLRWFESFGTIDPSSIFIIANDTFHRSYGTQYLSDFSLQQIVQMRASGGIVGYVDAFPEPVTLMSLSFQKWIRSSLLISTYRTLKRLSPLNQPLQRETFFRPDSDPKFFAESAPLSSTYQDYLRTWLFAPVDGQSHFQEEWHSKQPLSEQNVASMREKAMCIFNEHSLSARAQSLGIPLIASNRERLPAFLR